MSHSIPSYIVLGGILLIFFLVIRQVGLRKEKKADRGFSKYALAKNELSLKVFNTASGIMYSYLKERMGQTQGPLGQRADKVLGELFNFSKVRRKRKKEEDLVSLAKEYISVMREVESGRGLG